MADDPLTMQEQAQRCRRLANAASDQKVAEALTALAREYDARAIGHAPGTKPDGR